MDKKIIKGVEVMCIHDHHDKKIGDRGIVAGFHPGCGHLLLEESQLHYEDEHFVKFSEGPVSHFDEDKVDVQEVLNFIDDINRCILLHANHGLIPVEVIFNRINYNLNALHLKELYFAPKNKIDEG
jgi:hypothetical protein